MKTIINFARLILAPVFIFSGFVKAIDPLGSTYKFSDYFEAFGLDFMMPLAFVLAILLSTAELLIGLSLLFGVLMRITSWALMIFMSFFTVLTLVIAITNPVTDCGCFGDALVLTNWQTFTKNIIFMIPTLIIFFSRRRYKPITSIGAEWSIVLLFTVIGVSISIASYRNLPFLDFRPYSVGTHIPSSMIIPEGAQLDEYEIKYFIYEKDGKQKEFTLDALPNPEDGWDFIDRVEELVKKGYEPPIHDFSITTLNGEDITDSILSNNMYTVLVISSKIEKSSKEGFEKMNRFTDQIKASGGAVYGLTASPTNSINKYINEHNINYDFHLMDEIQLKTIVRANPGAVLLKDGVVIGKWHYRKLPNISIEKKESILSAVLKKSNMVKERWIIAFSLVGLTLLMISLFVIVQLRR